VQKTASAAHAIREHLQAVADTHARVDLAGQSEALRSVQNLQTARFAHSYADFLAQADTQAAAAFFLNQLYAHPQAQERDQGFARIASSIERLFPASVADLALELAAFYALSAGLDASMASHWQSLEGVTPLSTAQRYQRAWQRTGGRDLRMQQIQHVHHLGQALIRLTRKKSLLLAVRMMRRPAKLAGLSALHATIEAGFDAFSRLHAPDAFLNTIVARESHGVRLLFGQEGPEAAAWINVQPC
jgi:hypothetical protein